MLLRKVKGSVISLQCGSCGATFPHFRFSGEDDSETSGLYSLTSTEKNEVVVAEMEPSEWNANPSLGIRKFVDRVKKEMHRSDLYSIELLRIEDKKSAGIGFQEFLKNYAPPVEIFACKHCEVGECRVVEELTIEEFRGRGGNVIAMGAIAV